MDSPRVFEDKVLRHKLSFSEAQRDGRPVTRVEMWVRPGGGVPPHIHPSMSEDFEVLDGELEILSGRRWISAGPGEHVLIEPCTRHAYRNRGDAVAHGIAWADPPSQLLEDFLSDAADLAEVGALTRHGLPKRPSALLQAAVLSEHYREMVVLGFPPMPPAGLDRLIMRPLSRIGRRRGYRPGAILGTEASQSA